MDDEDLINGPSASEDEDDDKRHAKLLDAISGLGGKKVNKRSQRTVPTNQVSEFNFTAATDDTKVKLHELVGTLKTSAKHGSLKNQLNRVQNQKILSVPLPKHQKEKIEREVAYKNTTKEVSKWDSVVNSNRQAEQLQFPLQKSEVHLLNTTGKFKQLKPRTPLELEIAAVLSGNRDVLPTENKELTPAEERALAAMDLEEAKEHRAELQKFRALMSYKEAKAKRQKRIKSKKYHRVLKKEKLKHEKKALEELEKNDPTAYQEKLEDVERQRIEERMSLKHRGGSKYSKKQMLYAKYDDQARQRVQDMLQTSRQLTQKSVAVSDSEDDKEELMDSEDEMIERELSSLSSNPWMKAAAQPVAKSEFSRPEVVLNSEGKEEEESECESNEDEDVLMKMGRELEKRQKKAVHAHLVEEEMEKIIQKQGDQTQEKESSVQTLGEGVRNSQNKKNKTQNKKKAAPKMEENIDEIFQKLEDKVQDDRKKVEEDVKGNTENKKKKKRRRGRKKMEDQDDEAEKAEDMNDAPLISEGLKRKKTLDDLEEDEEEEEESISGRSSMMVKRENEITNNGSFTEDSPNIKEEVFVDPKKLFTLETKISDIANPDVTGKDAEEESDGEEAQRSIIAQAFADDDVIDDFVKEKNAIVDRDKPTDIDLFLPGWGAWGGESVKVSKRKRKKFIIKAPEGPPRKDKRLGNVIISEKKDKAISKHQVNDLPFPYVTVEQYEQAIRAPIGKTWNPETAVKELVKPKIVTKLGGIIQPISKADVFKKDSKKRKPDMGFQNIKSVDTKHKKRKH